MTFNRDKNQDRRRTQDLMNVFLNSNVPKNWLGHSGACSKIDALLLHGASFKELLSSGRKPSAIRAHLYHLKTEHGLNILNVNDVYSFLCMLKSDTDTKTKNISISINRTAEEELIAVIKPLADKKRSFLDSLKEESKGLDREDFIWHYLLQSFSTMGKASGWHGLIGNERNYRRITYKTIKTLSSEERISQVKNVCCEAGIRMPNLKASYILECFTYVKSLGGLRTVKDKLLSQQGRDGKIKFLQTFP
ncbi:MAG: hypothetical protein FD181_1917 [Prolixibacteraceae bacterium]|nr:MAG: hypothetical protein FD181_1917 [Prolixibacteraceae bacterium]